MKEKCIPPSFADERKAKFNTLISKAKELSRQGNLEKALGLLEKAYTIRQSEKLQKKIEKLKVNNHADEISKGVIRLTLATKTVLDAIIVHVK